MSKTNVTEYKKARNALPSDIRDAAEIMAEKGTFETGQAIMKAAANEIDRLNKLVGEWRGCLVRGEAQHVSDMHYRNRVLEMLRID